MKKYCVYDEVWNAADLEKALAEAQTGDIIRCYGWWRPTEILRSRPGTQEMQCDSSLPYAGGQIGWNGDSIVLLHPDGARTALGTWEHSVEDTLLLDEGVYVRSCSGADGWAIFVHKTKEAAA